MIMSARELVQVFYDELWNAWNDARVDEVLDESLEFRGSLGLSTVGRRQWRSYRHSVRTASADFHSEVVTLIATDAQGPPGSASPPGLACSKQQCRAPKITLPAADYLTASRHQAATRSAGNQPPLSRQTGRPRQGHRGLLVHWATAGPAG